MNIADCCISPKIYKSFVNTIFFHLHLCILSIKTQRLEFYNKHLKSSNTVGCIKTYDFLKQKFIFTSIGCIFINIY